MADNENIIEDLDTLLGQPINEQPVGVPQDQHDLYDSYIDAINSGDNSRRSTIKKFIDAEEQGLAGSEAWNRAAADHQLPEGTIPDTSFESGFTPGLISGLTVDNLGMLNRAVDWDMLEFKGDDPNRGLIDYFSNTFKGAFSGEDQPGEMFISWEELEARPDLQEYLANAAAGMKQNSIRLMDEFAEDKKFRTEEEFYEWLDELKVKEAAGELTEEDRDDIAYVQKLQFQKERPRAFVPSEDGNGILITHNTLPDIAHEPDPKFVDGRLQLPYYGTLERNEQGELTKPAASMFRFTDNPGIPGIAEKYAPGVEKEFGDFLYPKLSPWWDYGENSKEQMGYQLGQIASGVGVVRSLGKPLVKHGYKAGKGLYNLARRKLLGYEPVDTSSWKLTP